MNDAAIDSINKVLSDYLTCSEEEQTLRENIRETVKELDKYSKQIQSVLQGIHLSSAKINDVCTKAREIFVSSIQPQYKILSTKVPPGEYFRFHDCWRFTTQILCSSSALIYYLETEDLVDKETMGGMLGLKTLAGEENVYLDIEDYLWGLLHMASELSRFTVNSVTNGDYGRPARIGNFMKELTNGFGELQLKNDFLRRKYDGLKYDVRKIEQVIYDLSVRGLTPPCNPPTLDGKDKDNENEEDVEVK